MRRTVGAFAAPSLLTRLVSLAVALLAVLGALVVPPAPPAGAVPGMRVFMLGDSTMESLTLLNPGALTTIQSSYSVAIDAAGCRRTRFGGCKAGGLPISGVETLTANAEVLANADVLVVMLGYNDDPATFGSDVTAVMEHPAVASVGRVLWLTMQDVSSRAWEVSNATLFAAEARYPNLRVADWDSYADGHSSWFQGDGFHLSYSGASQLAAFIKGRLDELPLTPSVDRCASVNAMGRPVPAPAALTGPALAPTGYTPNPSGPKRLVDTRAVTEATFPDGVQKRIGPGRSYQLPITSRSDVPDDVTAVVLNTTITGPCDTGYLTVYPCGTTSPPLSSNLNYLRDQTVANLVTVAVGDQGAVCLYSRAQTDVVVDLAGWFRAGATSGYHSLAPFRAVDTRPGFPAALRIVNMIGPPFALSVPLAGVRGLPAASGMTAVAVNVTITQPTAPGYLTLYPCGTTRPTASNVNFVAGQTVPNMAVVKPSADGRICVYSSVRTHLVLDVFGWFGAGGSTFVSATPLRILDTRPTTTATLPIKTRLRAGTTLTVPIGSASGLPDGAAGVVLNVTTTRQASAGWLAAFPCGQARPVVSNLNFRANDTVPNLVVVPVGAGAVCLYTAADTDVVADVMGWFGT